MRVMIQQQQYRQCIYAASSLAQQQPQQVFGKPNSSLPNAGTQQPSWYRQEQHHVLNPYILAPMDPFEIFGKDVHCHILSYILCIRNGRAKAPRSACWYFVEANLLAYMKANPHPRPWAIYNALGDMVEALPVEEQAKWNKLAEQDKERYDKEEAFFTRPYQLAWLCKNHSLISKH